MKKYLGFASVLATAVALFTVAAPASATVITQTINLDQVHHGYQPAGPAPWLAATFTYNVGSKTGTLVLTSRLGDGFVQGATGITGWGFYLSGNTVDFNNSTCAGVCADTFTSNVHSSASIDGSFNLGFGWTSQNRFDGTDTATYTLMFDSTLGSSSPFVVNSGGWYSYAHVQGMTPNDCSGWIVAGDGTGTLGTNDGLCGGTPPPHNVPEPGALGMFGLGVLLIGGFLGWRRRYS
jgi:hypothetical protein